jgi:hypothetical protein
VRRFKSCSYLNRRTRPSVRYSFLEFLLNVLVHDVVVQLLSARDQEMIRVKISAGNIWCLRTWEKYEE